jgi:hypothetical protein
MTDRLDLSKISRQQAVEFMANFTNDSEVLQQMADSTEHWAHMTRVMARIAVYGSDGALYDTEALYVKERMDHPNRIDEGDPERARVNATNFLKHFVPQQSESMEQALTWFMEPDGTNGEKRA